VVGALTPWNAPFCLNIAETVPASMAGNTLVRKSAQLTPWSGSEYSRIVAGETDIPPPLSSAPRIGMIGAVRDGADRRDVHRVDGHQPRHPRRQAICTNARSGRESENSRYGHHVSTPPSSQLSGSRMDTKFEKPQWSRTTTVKVVPAE